MRPEAEIDYYETSLSTNSHGVFFLLHGKRGTIFCSQRILLENSDIGDSVSQIITIYEVRFRVFHVPSNLTPQMAIDVFCLHMVTIEMIYKQVSFAVLDVQAHDD